MRRIVGLRSGHEVSILAASKFSVEAVTAPVHDAAKIEAIMSNLGGRSDVGLIFPVDPFTYLHRI